MTALHRADLAAALRQARRTGWTRSWRGRQGGWNVYVWHHAGRALTVEVTERPHGQVWMTLGHQMGVSPGEPSGGLEVTPTQAVAVLTTLGVLPVPMDSCTCVACPACRVVWAPLEGRLLMPVVREYAVPAPAPPSAEVDELQQHVARLRVLLAAHGLEDPSWSNLAAGEKARLREADRATLAAVAR